MSNSNETTYTERFSRSNPPGSIEIAKQTLDELDESIAIIQAQLQRRSSNDFDSDADYSAWKNKAIRAEGHSIAERNFLESWLRNGSDTDFLTSRPEVALTPKQKAHYLALGNNRLRKEVRAIYLRLDILVSEWGNQEDISVAEARNRIGKISELQLIIEQERIAADDVISKCGLTQAKGKDLKSPLLGIETKLRQVRAPLSARLSQHRYFMEEFCVTALQRAVETGFVLTDEEQMALSEYHIRRTED